jgi:large subunit ribosomal protein L7/L12
MERKTGWTIAAAILATYLAFVFIYLPALAELLSFHRVSGGAAIGKAFWPLIGVVIAIFIAIVYACDDGMMEWWSAALWLALPLFGAACGVFNALLSRRTYIVGHDSAGNAVPRDLGAPDCAVLFMPPVLTFLIVAVVIAVIAAMIIFWDQVGFGYGGFFYKVWDKFGWGYGGFLYKVKTRVGGVLGDALKAIFSVPFAYVLTGFWAWWVLTSGSAFEVEVSFDSFWGFAVAAVSVAAVGFLAFGVFRFVFWCLELFYDNVIERIWPRKFWRFLRKTYYWIKWKLALPLFCVSAVAIGFVLWLSFAGAAEADYGWWIFSVVLTLFAFAAIGWWNQFKVYLHFARQKAAEARQARVEAQNKEFEKRLRAETKAPKTKKPASAKKPRTAFSKKLQTYEEERAKLRVEAKAKLAAAAADLTAAPIELPAAEVYEEESEPEIYEEEAAPEKPFYDIVLKSAGAQKIQVIKIVREIANLLLGDAKILVDGAPQIIMTYVVAADAKKYEKMLKDAGADVELK